MPDLKSVPEKTDAKRAYLRKGRLIFLIGAPVVLLGGLMYVFFVDPSENPRDFVPCLTHALTGLYCPGCGNTRALHALLHLRFPEMLHDNLLFPLTAVAVLWLLASGYLRVLFGRRILWLPDRVPMPIWILLCVVLILFTVLRNIPFYPFTLLAPI